MAEASREPHRPSMRNELVDRTLELARTGQTASLDSAARAAGMTKAGVLYHFRTKEALVAAVLDHLLDGYEQELSTFAQTRAGDQAAPTQRLSAYIDWAFDGEFGHADLLMFIDPNLRDALSERWRTRISSWVAVPETLPVATRARLHSARLIADGHWFNTASNGVALPPQDKAAIRRLAHDLTKEPS